MVVPTVVLVISVLLVNAQGPYYLGMNNDPEYCYLFNSLNILKLKMPGHTDHPGTTLQEFGALVVSADWLIRSAAGNRESVFTSVLSHPESYLRDTNYTLVVAIAGSLFWAGLAILRSTGSVIAALLAQSSLFLFPDLVVSLSRVSPEPLLIATGFTLLALIAPILYGEQRDRALLAGALVGFGLVTKVTFFPWIVVGLMFRGRSRILFAVSMALTGLILLFPIFPALPRVARWLVSLALHSEKYGSGPVGLPAMNQVLDHARKFFYFEPALGLLLAFYAAIIVAIGLVGNRRREPRVRATQIIVAVALSAILIQILITLKHFESRYTVPSLVLACGLNSLVFVSLSAHDVRPAMQRIAGLVALVIFGVGIVWTKNRVDQSMLQAHAHVLAADRLAQDRSEHPECFVIGYYRSSLPSFALNFGSEFSAGVHGALLSKLYSDQIAYNKFDGVFWSYSLGPRLAAVEQMLKEGRCVWMQGSPEPGPRLRLPKELTVVPFEVSGSEELYRLAFITNNGLAAGGRTP